ncbi:MAG: aminopeptidase [Crocinitomicaceae bacterium]|jgi:putative aminopeptidase FrvX|nr:aminopeptidase [Crocinitomicaceae bacterium]
MKLLKQLTAISGASSDESRIKKFLLKYINENKNKWKVTPTIFASEEFQDCIVLVFGKPKTAIYAHIDTIGFSVAYDNQLVKIGGPDIQDGIHLVGKDKEGKIETELMVIEQENERPILKCIYPRIINRGTILTYKPNFRETSSTVQSPYLDNRLGVWSALKVAETLENGAIVFGTYEEHGGNSVGYISRFLFEKYAIRQALISDITWITDFVSPGKGVVISMRDSGLPRRSYLEKIIKIAEKSGIDFQLEVESAGGSDGSSLQKSDLLIDWCFIGAAEDNVHTSDEIVSKYDIMCMVELFKVLMKKL